MRTHRLKLIYTYIYVSSGTLGYTSKSWTMIFGSVALWRGWFVVSLGLVAFFQALVPSYVSQK